MSWQELILIQAFLTGLATLITRSLAKDKNTAKGAFVITAGWFIVLFLVGLAMLPWFGAVQFSAWHVYWPRFALSGITFALANIFTYLMLKYVDAGVGSIFGTLNALFTLVGATIILHEDLTLLQTCGAFFLIFAIIYALHAVHPHGARKVHRHAAIGFGYALLGAVFFAVASINQKDLLGHVSMGSYLLFGWGWEAIAAGAVAVMIQPKMFRLFKNIRVIIWTVILGVLRAISGVCFMMALVRSNNVGLITVISSFKLIIVVLLGLWILKERQRFVQKMAASAIAIAALALMFWQK